MNHAYKTDFDGKITAQKHHETNQTLLDESYLIVLGLLIIEHFSYNWFLAPGPGGA